MYNYLGVLRKSTAIEHCISCNFFGTKTPDLILSKNNRLEFYSLTEDESLLAKKYINIYGKIKILLKIPSKKEKDNIFVLSQDLNFCIFSYDLMNNNINIPISGSIKEDLGKIQDEFLYCLDSNKNYLMICAYKNIFKIICVNTDFDQFIQYRNYTIRFQYEKIMFVAPFYLGNINNKEKDNDDKNNNNILNYVIIKQVYNEQNDLNDENNNNIVLKKEIVMETIQLKIENDFLNPMDNLYKGNVVSNGKVSSLKVNSKLRKIMNSKNNNININDINLGNKNKKIQKNTNKENKTIFYNYEKIMDNANFLDTINVEEEESINLIITHPEGFIIIFFSTYAIYYQYNYSNKALKSSKSIKYNKRRFINYVLIDEKNPKYYIIDDAGYLYLFRLFNIQNKGDENKENSEMNLELMGIVNPPSCLAYLNNNILFIGSIKGNNPSIKINENLDNNNINSEKIEIKEEYESLSPINNMILLNNTKEENGIEILTVSGVGKNCSIKNIKKGTNILYNGEIEIKNIKQVFKIIIYNKKKIKNPNYCSFIITTSMKSFIINYDYKSKIVSLNSLINFENNEKVIFAKNIENIILIVTNIYIYIYQNNSKFNLISKVILKENGKNPLLVKYNKNIQGLFVYFNNNNLLKYNIDIKEGNITSNEIIFNDIPISTFDVCKEFLIFAMWENNKLGIYSFNNKKIYYIDWTDTNINFVSVSCIQIIKLNDEYNIILSLSIGKLVYMKLNKQINNKENVPNDINFKKEDFIIKQNYNINLENFNIKKIKTNSNKFLFLDTSLPCLIYFNRDNLIISNFNANNCKDIIPLDNLEQNFLFIFNNKISFGSFSGNQNQNIYTLKSGKTINDMKLIDFSENEINKRYNNFKQKKFILTIEETEITKELYEKNINIPECDSIKSSLVLNDIKMEEIARYNFEFDNEIIMKLIEINLNEIQRKKFFVLGTGITDNKKSEPKIGHLYLMEINVENNISIKKLQEIELKGGVYAMSCYKNFIYVGIKDTLYIYSIIKKNHENFYEFKLIRQHSDFDLINYIYISKDIIYKEEEDDDKDNQNEEMIIEKPEMKEINEIYICDIYKTIILFRYDIINDKLKEISRDNNPTWIYNIEQCKKNILYITDIDNNIISLKKLSKMKNKKEKFKLEQISNFNLGERITSLVSTKIENKNLSKLTLDNDSEDELYENNNKKNNISDNNTIVTYFGTMEGSVGYIIPLDKHVYEFLFFLQELLIKKTNIIGGFNYKLWRSSKDGYNVIESKGFIEGDIIKEFLNYDDDYKKIILKELNYPWKKSVKEVVNIIETLNNFY